MEALPNRERSRKVTTMAFGRCVILELYGCPPELLGNESHLRRLRAQTFRQAGGVLLELSSHCFAPQGVTAIGLLTESHIPTHT